MLWFQAGTGTNAGRAPLDLTPVSPVVAILSTIALTRSWLGFRQK